MLIELECGDIDMVFKYNIEFDKESVEKNLDRITNQIFKLLPNREEGGDWETPLENLILEVTGMKMLWVDQPELFSLLCRMEALTTLTEEDDFFAFRKLIFECLGILSNIKKCLQD
jgi:hypothetical protein